MKSYTANRLSSGNKLFPAEIKIDNYGVTLRVPGLFSGKEKSLGFDKISSVRVDNPMIGFSTILFDTIGHDRIKATGFEKSDAQEIKEAVQQGIASMRTGSFNNAGYSQVDTTASQAAIRQAEALKAKVELDKLKHEDEINLKRKEIELEETKNKQKRADELRSQGKTRQAFFVEHRSTIGTVALVVITAIIGLFFYLSTESDQKLDADLTRKDETIQSLIQQGDKVDALKLIDDLQDDSQGQSRHEKSSFSNYTYAEYWQKRREDLRKQIGDLNNITAEPKQEAKRERIATTQTETSTESNSTNVATNGKYPFASTRLLMPSDLTDLDSFQLKVIKNEIFARHGYIFKSNDMKEYFQMQDWYKPLYNDVTNQLSDIEKTNIGFIKNFKNEAYN